VLVKPRKIHVSVLHRGNELGIALRMDSDAYAFEVKEFIGGGFG
jgi:hypothetical protein